LTAVPGWQHNCLPFALVCVAGARGRGVGGARGGGGGARCFPLHTAAAAALCPSHVTQPPHRAHGARPRGAGAAKDPECDLDAPRDVCARTQLAQTPTNQATKLIHCVTAAQLPALVNPRSRRFNPKGPRIHLGCPMPQPRHPATSPRSWRSSAWRRCGQPHIWFAVWGNHVN
jgi:hypothetical protein